MRHDPTSAFSVPRSFFASPPTSLLSLLALACLFSSLLFSCVGMDRTKEYLCSGGCPSWAACRTNDTFCRLRCSEPNPSRGDCYCSSTNECASSEICEQNACRTSGRQTFTTGGATFAMRFIPAGSFVMGSLADEKERSSDEGPQRTVTISRAFWMLETEVTQGQYKALVGKNPSHFSSCGDTCPVEQVLWDDAAVFANTLSAQQNLPSCFTCNAGGCDIPDKAAYLACKGWRLPTEAEWEYAARAGTTTRFHTGDCITSDQANFDGNYPPEGCPKGEYRVKPVGVGSFAANAWGLHDMHGNVWEWVADWYEGSYDSNDLGDPLQLLGSNPSRRSARVVRGGSWNSHGGWLRSAKRDWNGPALRVSYLGFRLSRSR